MTRTKTITVTCNRCGATQTGGFPKVPRGWGTVQHHKEESVFSEDLADLCVGCLDDLRAWLDVKLPEPEAVPSQGPYR